VIVIDNEGDEVRRLGNLLETAFPDWNVLPEKKRREQPPFQDWKAAVDFLLSVEDTDVVLCLDLSFEKDWDWDSIERGLRRARDVRADRARWTFVAYTKHSLYAKSSPGFAATFDGLIEKSNLVRELDHASAALFVRAEIERARARRCAPGSETIPSNLRITDSLGMRSFRAAFSDEVLGELVRAEAGDWGALRIESLTSGYSGAFMLALTSEQPGRSLIVKLARHESTIEHELQAQRIYLPELSPFCAKLVTIEPELRRLRDGSGVYYRQLPVKGVTVLQHCLTNSLPDNLRALERVSRVCMRVLRAVPVANRPTESARTSFELSPVDIGRLETSTDFLAELGQALASTDLWPTSLPSARIMATEINDLASSWSRAEITDVQLPQAVQHGDLNPGNVMLDEDGDPVLIDFQRLRRWPLGYDMARLAGLIRIRLTDVRDRADWLPFRLAAWCDASVPKVNGMAVDDHICPEATSLDKEFFEYAVTLPDADRLVVEYGYHLGSVWDLIKIISYQDISPMKRCWALVRCWALTQGLRRDRVNLPPAI
jgi:hypothetical protein